MTLFCIGADILFLKVIDVSEFGSKSAVLLGIVAYLAILTGGYLGKWDKELKIRICFYSQILRQRNVVRDCDGTCESGD